MTNALNQPGTALLALIAYQNLRLAESLQSTSDLQPDLAARLDAARLAGDQLARLRKACDAVPGGHAGAHSVIEPITSAVDEFWSMTKPRVPVERWIRVLTLSSLELELVQAAEERLPAETWELIAPDAGLWRGIDLGAQGVQASIAADADELSLYARRLLGEAAVMGQRLLVRSVGLRQVLAGDDDPELVASSAVLAEILARVATRLRQLGFGV